MIGDDGSSSSSRKRRKFWLGVGFVGAVAGSVLMAGPFLTPTLRRHCLPYLPATDNTVRLIFNEIKGSKSPLIDLGSGDGRVVIEAAKHGFTAHGVELNIWLVMYSRLNSLLKGTSSRTTFYRRDLWKYDLSTYKTLVIFGGESLMDDLSRKLKTEVSPGSLVISCRFPLDKNTWTPTKVIEDGPNPLWIYRPK